MTKRKFIKVSCWQKIDMFTFERRSFIWWKDNIFNGDVVQAGNLFKKYNEAIKNHDSIVQRWNNCEWIKDIIDGMTCYFGRGLTEKKLIDIDRDDFSQRIPSNDIVIDTPYKTDSKINEELGIRVKEIYPVDFVKNGDIGKYIIEGHPKFITLDGDVVKMNSVRLKTFLTKGCKCVTCGLEGKWFYKVMSNGQCSYHLELFGEKDGKLVLMTKDHIIPKSKGGSNGINNMQTMCCHCNEVKKDNLTEENISKGVMKRRN